MMMCHQLLLVSIRDWVEIPAILEMINIQLIQFGDDPNTSLITTKEKQLKKCSPSITTDAADNGG